jgi:hypothetical protein
LNDIFGIQKDDLKKYNVNLPRISPYNQQSNRYDEQPLDVFIRNKDDYKKWQEWKGNLDENGKVIKQKFTRDIIISFANMYNDGNDIYLFTGIYKIINRLEDKYEVERCSDFDEYSGRLIIKHKRQGCGISFRLETIIENIEVREILSQPMKCKVFSGLNNINLKFIDLEIIIRNNVKDWQNALSNMKGIYPLIDDGNNKKYIGSAYGEYGIWSRWSNYINNYTGGNKGLDDLHKKVGEEHFKNHFRFVLLEYFSDKTDDNYVINRESFWKEVFNSRKESCSYNCN